VKVPEYRLPLDRYVLRDDAADDPASFVGAKD